MCPYLLTEQQLVDNRYPCSTPKRGVACINREGAVVAKVKVVGPNAVQHECCRCHKPFIIYNDGQYQTVESCSYHYGKAFKYRGQWVWHGPLQVKICLFVCLQSMVRVWFRNTAVVRSDQVLQDASWLG